MANHENVQKKKRKRFGKELCMPNWKLCSSAAEGRMTVFCVFLTTWHYVQYRKVLFCDLPVNDWAHNPAVCIKSDVASPVFVFLHSCVNQCIESREVDLEGCLSLGRVGYLWVTKQQKQWVVLFVTRRSAWSLWIGQLLLKWMRCLVCLIKNFFISFIRKMFS